VQFRLDAPGAREVALAGDFTDWEPTYVLRHSGRGVWTVVAPLAPGVHSYAFVINGERWVPDPMAPAIEDGFGGLNSRVAIITPDRQEQAS
jgi:1,4-alpha-glucan branching enzyme